MEIDKIISVSGKPGLFNIVTQTRSGFVVESLLDGKKLSLNIKSNVSLLSEISIYTYSEEVSLASVFAAIAEKENNEKTISHKESKEVLETYFREVLPEYDEDRVYASDIKKVVQWYNLLLDKGVEFKLEQVKEE
ncbi:MAG: DUF5606 domain-containing protein [Flavobacteriales bacterium]|nr:DUF5606 domain-containing protein [Flavobacteriales bacterium]